MSLDFVIMKFCSSNNRFTSAPNANVNALYVLKLSKRHHLDAKNRLTSSRIVIANFEDVQHFNLEFL